MEEFSEQQNANAVKFLQEYLEKGTEGAQMKWLRAQFPQEEVEGECLAMARSHLAERQCPGIFSYHISHHAVQRLQASSLDELWVKEEKEAEEGKSEVSTEPSDKTKLLDAVLVAAALLTAIRDVCSEWVKALPHLTQVPGAIDISFYAIKNNRRKMEDKHAICVDINSLFGLKDCPPQSFYAVYDGHVSVEAASYAAVHVLPNIVRHPDFLTNPQSALKAGIDITDKRFCHFDKKAGSTAVVTLLRGGMLYTAWVGDSQAMLFRKGRGLQLVDPHKPDREDERQRIEDLGGLVIWLGAWRVNGNLSVSRSIGDGADKKFITGDAEVRTDELDGTEDYLVVACDGVWDVLNSEEMAEDVHAYLTSGGGTKHTLAHGIIDAARREGSGDNMTVIVIYFDTFELVDPKTLPKLEEKKEEEVKETDVAATEDGSGSTASN